MSKTIENLERTDVKEISEERILIHLRRVYKEIEALRQRIVDLENILRRNIK